MRKLLAIVTTVILTGCTAVVSPKPVGLTPVRIHADAITGTWECEGEEAFRVTVLDQTNAIIEVRINESRDPSKPEWRSVRVHLMCGAKWHYASIPMAKDGTASEGYVFACYHFTPDKIRAWGPDVESIKRLVETRAISGRVIKGRVHLDEEMPRLISMIESEEHGLLFDWREPYILRRMKESGRAEQTLPPISGTRGTPAAYAPVAPGIPER